MKALTVLRLGIIGMMKMTELRLGVADMLIVTILS